MDTPSAALPARYTDRAGAAIVDALIVSACGIAILLALPDALDAVWAWVFLALVIAYSWAFHAGPRGATPGKRSEKLRIVALDGSSAGPRRALVRALAWSLYLLPWLTPVLREPPYLLGGLALLMAPPLFTPQRRALHDYLAGTRVVSTRPVPTPEQAAEEARRRRRQGLIRVAVVLAVIVPIAWLFLTTYQERALMGRVLYAYGEADKLRLGVDRYAEEHGKLPPDAAALGVPRETPYPEGGSYTLEGGGSIVIRFMVHPRLKGGTITLRPQLAADGKIDMWKCSALGIERKFLPNHCRS